MLEQQEEQEALQPVIVLTDCAVPYRIIGVSANWGKTFGTSAREVVGRSINLLFGPETDAKGCHNVLKQASHCNSSMLSTVMYEKSGAAKRFTMFGKASDVISPPACELYIYPTDALRRALTNNTVLVVSNEDPYTITYESGDHMDTACLDIVGRPLLEVYASCGLDVSRLQLIMEKVSAEGSTFRETFWENIDVRVCATTTEDSTGVILVAFVSATASPDNSPICKMVEAVRPHSRISVPRISCSSPSSQGPAPDTVYLLIQEGGGFSQRKDDTEHFVRVSVNGASIDSKPKDDASPLWNEERHLALQQLPAVVRIEAVVRSSSGEESLIGSAEIELGDQAVSGYCDDWISLKVNGRKRCRVRLALSCQEAHIDKIKQGLFPPGAHKFSVNT